MLGLGPRSFAGNGQLCDPGEISFFTIHASPEKVRNLRQRPLRTRRRRRAPWEPMEDATPWSLRSVTTLIVHDVGPVLPCVPHLTRFKPREREGLTEIDQLLEFLDNCPLLEDIDIYYAAETLSSRRQLVSLPTLRTYTQPKYDEYYTLRLFNMLSLPPSSSVTTKWVTWPE